MIPAKKFDREYLSGVVKKCKSMREVGKILGAEARTARSALLRYNISYSHFEHGRAYEHMINQKYNMLTVVSIYKEKKNGNIHTLAECLCDCGKRKNILASSIKAKRTGSCGCDKSRYEKTRGKNGSLYKGYEDISGKLWGVIQDRATRRGYEFELNIKYAWKLFIKQNKKCALSNIPICFGQANSKVSCTTASLDRINSKKGYIESNVQWVHKSLNIMKNSLPCEVFIGLCNKVHKTCGDKGLSNISQLSNNYFAGRGGRKPIPGK